MYKGGSTLPRSLARRPPKTCLARPARLMWTSEKRPFASSEAELRRAKTSGSGQKELISIAY